MPYRDVWDHKPPGVYLLDLLAGANAWGVFVLQVTLLAAASWLSYRALAGGGLGAYGAVFGTLAWVVAMPRLFLEDGLASWTSPEPQYVWPPETSRIVDFVESNYERVGTLRQSGWPVWRLRSS